MDKSYLKAPLHILPDEIRIDLLAHGVYKVEVSGGFHCIECEAYDAHDNKVDVSSDEIKTSLSWVIVGLNGVCYLENLEKAKFDLVENRLVMDDPCVSASRVKFLQFGDGTIQCLGGKYDGSILYDIEDHRFLYENLSGRLIQS